MRDEQRRAIAFFRDTPTNIEPANAIARIPAETGSVDAVYSSHMLEHLDQQQARRFLSEVARVLKPNGIIRLVVPDLKKLVQQYVASEDANTFMTRLLVTTPSPRTFIERVQLALVGFRHHLWMYDATSLCTLLTEVGFHDVANTPPGETRIVSPGALDLREREEESLFVEARR